MEKTLIFLDHHPKQTTHWFVPKLQWYTAPSDDTHQDAENPQYIPEDKTTYNELVSTRGLKLHLFDYGNSMTRGSIHSRPLVLI